MSIKKKKSFALRLRNYFFTGVIVLIPIGFTLYLSKFLINFSTKLVPSGLNPNTYLPYAIPGIEIILTIIFITVVGGLSLTFIGKKFLEIIIHMPKQNNETDFDYKQRVLDPLSSSMCGAKWYNATIWLGSGMTTSCHHPLPHKIDPIAVQTNPKLLHNTPEKKQQRKQRHGYRA